MIFSKEMDRGMLLAAAGGVGGLLAWFTPILAGNTVGAHISFLVAVGNVLAGAVAAIVGIYMVARTDTTHLMHGIALALVCGIAWNPVLQTAVNLFQSNAAKGDVIEATDRLRESTKELTTSVNNMESGQISAVADSAASLAETLSTVEFSKDKSIKSTAEKQINEALEAITTAGANNPNVAVEAIRKVGMAGALSGSDRVSRAASQALDNLAASALDEEVKSYIFEASAEISGLSDTQ